MVKTEELDKTDNSMIFIERDTALNKEEIYIEENVSSKVVKIIQSYTGVVNKMVWRKEV